MTYDVTIEVRDEQPAAVVRGQESLEDLATFLRDAFEDVGKALADQHLFPAGPPFGQYRVVGSGFDVAAGFPCSAPVVAVGAVEPLLLPGGMVATTVHVGSYDRVGAAYEAVAEWLASTGRVPNGEPWECYLDDPTVAEPRTLVCFPCAAAPDAT